MSSVNSLQELLLEQIQDLYDAEGQLVKALPKMAEAATSPELQQGFTAHLEQTKQHVTRLEQVFECLGAPKKAKTCKAMKGLIAEGTEAIDLDAPDAIRDAGLIGAARRVEHYEIAAYSAAIALADKLDQADVVELLEQTLEEEEATDDSLAAAADAVNDRALTVGSTAE